MLQAVCEFYSKSRFHPIIMVLLYWAFWPGLMFVVAWVFESRTVYLGSGQSRMFFPGDFVFGIGIVAFIGMYAKNPVWDFAYTARYWLIMAVLHIILALLMRHGDVMQYPIDSRNSPTKIIHDFCGYFVCFWLPTTLGLPQLIWLIKNPESFEKTKGNWFVFAGCALFFISILIWDLTHPPSK